MLIQWTLIRQVILEFDYSLKYLRGLKGSEVKLFHVCVFVTIPSINEIRVGKLVDLLVFFSFTYTTSPVCW